MDPLKIIRKYYKPDSLAFRMLVEHSRMVVNKCLEISENIRHLSPDLSFLREAAMLHDIGIFLTSAPDIGCSGDYAYICHGYLGRELLEQEGLPMHALVCERHVGVGLGKGDILSLNLPLPDRDMLPLTLEEKIICYADKFYSKKTGAVCFEASVEEVRKGIGKYGADMLQRFDDMTVFFNKKSFRGKDPLQER